MMLKAKELRRLSDGSIVKLIRHLEWDADDYGIFEVMAENEKLKRISQEVDVDAKSFSNTLSFREIEKAENAGFMFDLILIREG